MGSRIGGPFNYRCDEFQCPKCGKLGAIIWEPGLSTKGQCPQFIKVTGDFYERIANTPPYPIEMVCRSCGGIQQAVNISGLEVPDIPLLSQDEAP